MSFYGGKQGRTYHLVEHFDSITAMCTQFAKGGQYTDVNYGEYVIIDTPYKGNSDNGIIYRRGFDYQSDPGTDTVKQPGNGAIYIGQIVGPAGQSPALVASTVMPESDTAATIHSTVSLPMASTVNVNTVSGTASDNVQLGYVNIVDQHGNIRGCYITINSPYLVMESTYDTDPYMSTSNIGVTEDATTIDHPYYYKWNFNIPAGKHGQDLTDLVATTFQIQQQPFQYLKPIYTNYDENPASTVASTKWQDWIPYRNIRNITSSAITGSTAQMMWINYTNILSNDSDASSLSSTFIPTQIDNIVTSTATPNQFTINLRTNDSIVPKSITIPSANLNISGTYGTTAAAGTAGWETGNIIEVNSQLYLFQQNAWQPIFTSLFNNLAIPEKYIQIGTQASTMLSSNKGVLLQSINRTCYWEEN